MQKLYRVNEFVGRHMPWFVLGCLALGLGFPDAMSHLSRVAVPLFAFMTFANSLGGGFREIGQVVRHPLPAVSCLLVLHVAMPLLTLAVGRVFFADAPLFALGLLLEYMVPTGVTTLMWVGIGGGNVPLCLALVLLDTLAAPFVIPLTLRVLAGSVVELDTLGMIGDMVVMVAIPALAAMALYQATGGRVASTLQPRLAPFAKLALLLIIISNSTRCAPFLHDINATLLKVVAAAFCLCVLGFALGYWAGLGLRQPFPTKLTMSLNAGFRNISVGAVLAAQYFPADVMFPVAFTPLFLQLTTSAVVKVLCATGSGRAWRARSAEKISQ
nr:bile acid:sodium symporter family protein [uncultured Oscillibacter sp.]